MKVNLIAALTSGFLVATTLLAEPTSQPADNGYEAVHADATDTQNRFKKLVPNNDALADANSNRAAVSAEAIEILKKQVSDLDEMIRLKPVNKWPILAVRANTMAELYALGDKETVSTLDQQAQLPGRDGLRAKYEIARAKWYMAGEDADKQTAALAALDKLAADQPGDAFVCQLLSDIGSAATDPDVRKHMVDLLSNTMDSVYADAAVRKLENESKVESHEGKPMVIAGKLPDGQPFTTADWKGKVILVDFWAAWCEPCKAELPRVKKVYSDYHDKGFEVLGVDNDYTAKSVTAYAEKAELPWPQLFNESAGAKGAWNPITVNFGIDGIPVMFLIDKKGICRTVSARENFEKLIPQMLAE